MSKKNQRSIAECPYCEKKGLPVLPLRYAVARTDVVEKTKAPRLDYPFGAGVEDVELPEGQAYTLRLLRPGYLYVYHEVRSTWSGYLVTPMGFLYPYVLEIDHDVLVAMNQTKFREVLTHYFSLHRKVKRLLARIIPNTITLDVVLLFLILRMAGMFTLHIPKRLGRSVSGTSMQLMRTLVKVQVVDVTRCVVFHFRTGAGFQQNMAMIKKSRCHLARQVGRPIMRRRSENSVTDWPNHVTHGAVPVFVISRMTPLGRPRPR